MMLMHCCSAAPSCQCMVRHGIARTSDVSGTSSSASLPEDRLEDAPEERCFALSSLDSASRLALTADACTRCLEPSCAPEEDAWLLLKQRAGSLAAGAAGLSKWCLCWSMHGRTEPESRPFVCIATF